LSYRFYTPTAQRGEKRIMVSSSGDAKFFVSTSKGEIAEWREELRRADQDKQIDVLKKGELFLRERSKLCECFDSDSRHDCG